MGKDSAIAWTHHSFNPVVGCQKVSPACDFCYAEAWAKRSGHPKLWNGTRRRTSAANWRQPSKWNTEAKAAGIRRRVFCASLADVFDNQWEEQWRHDLWRLIALTPHLDWLLLTKRPQNIKKMLPGDWYAGYENVWLGASVENQEEADRRIPHLVSVPAAVRFLSCEPLLGPIRLRDKCSGCGTESDAHHIACVVMERPWALAIDWVICGGESGPRHRSLDLRVVCELFAQCRAAGIPFFMKQDSARQPGQRGRIPEVVWVQEFPE